MGATDGDTTAFGDIETETRAAIEKLGDLEGIQGPLAAIAYQLARTLDLGAESKALAGIARELRETLTTIKEAADAGDAADELEAYLSAAVGDTTD